VYLTSQELWAPTTVSYRRLDTGFGVTRLGQLSGCVDPFVGCGTEMTAVDLAPAGRRIIPFLAVNPWMRNEAVAEVHRRADKGYRSNDQNLWMGLGEVERE